MGLLKRMGHIYFLPKAGLQGTLAKLKQQVQTAIYIYRELTSIKVLYLSFAVCAFYEECYALGIPGRMHCPLTVGAWERADAASSEMGGKLLIASICTAVLSVCLSSISFYLMHIFQFFQ